MTPERAFGAVVRTLRHERGLSQEQLADSAGFSTVYVSMVERGKSSPSLGAIFRLAAALHVSPGGLMDRTTQAILSAGDMS